VAHPQIENATPYVLEALPLLDEECRPLLVPVVKGTFRIDRGRCELADEQMGLELGGQCFAGDPESSSYRYEPEVAFHKPATDVVVIGQAHAPARATREMSVEVRVGGLMKTLRVVGDRVWFKAGGLATISTPAAFERMPLVYERAFGGWDRSHPDPEQHAVELRNPVGTGLRRRGFEEGVPLPNVEDPRHPISAPGDAPAPAGIGFTSPHWQPRARLAGTYDERWQRDRSPLLPADFDRRYFNAASPGLIAPGYLRGDEPVRVTGMTPDGVLGFALPGVAPPSIAVKLRAAREQAVKLELDTVIIEPDERRVMLLWRGHLQLATGPHDVAAISARVAAN
jgi:hypothetical protein